MAVPNAELEITYGAYVAGGVTGQRIDGFHQVSVGVETSEVRFTLFIVGSSRTDFVQKCKAAEVAFRTPNKDLVVRLGSSTLVEWRHGRNTGFDAVPEIVKPGVVGDSALSREYRITIRAGMPADKGTTAPGARRISMDIAYAPSRVRTVTFEGVFTALGSSSAREMYEAQIAAAVSARLTAIGGTYEVVEEELDVNTFDKLAEFRRVYRELIFSQAGSSPDDSSLVGQQIRLNKRIEHAQGSRDVSELATVDAEYSVFVDKTSSTDLEGKYADPIRDWLIARMAELLTGNQYGVTREDVRYDREANAISVTMSITGTDGGGNEVGYQLTYEDDVNEGTVLPPAWNGDPFARHIYQGPAAYLRRVSVTRTVIGTPGLADESQLVREVLDDARGAPTFFPAGGGPQSWDGVKFKTSTRRRDIGYDSGQVLTVTDVIATAVMEGYNPVQSGDYGNQGVVTGNNRVGADA